MWCECNWKYLVYQNKKNKNIIIIYVVGHYVQNHYLTYISPNITYTSHWQCYDKNLRDGASVF